MKTVHEIPAITAANRADIKQAVVEQLALQNAKLEKKLNQLVQRLLKSTGSAAAIAKVQENAIAKVQANAIAGIEFKVAQSGKVFPRRILKGLVNEAAETFVLSTAEDFVAGISEAVLRK